MTFVAAPEVVPEVHERAWGVVVGNQHYRVDVLLERNISAHPPEWFTFVFADPDNDGVLSVENWHAAALPHVALLGCEILEAELVALTRDEYHALALERSR